MSIADKLTTIAENQQKVYDAGFAAGKAQGGGSYDDGWNDGYDEGCSEYNAFWDTYQNIGERTVYDTAFAGEGWTAESFNPAYDIRPTSAYMMFRGSNISGDLRQILAFGGVVLDTSNLTNAQYMFNSSKFTHIGELDFRKVTNGYYIFQGCGELVTIDKIIWSATSHLHEDAFTNCAALENVVFEGEIAKNGLNMKQCSKLTKASITSIINCLSSTTSGLTATLSKTAVTNAFGSTTATEWTTLIGTKPNWTISLV